MQSITTDIGFRSVIQDIPLPPAPTQSEIGRTKRVFGLQYQRVDRVPRVQDIIEQSIYVPEVAFVGRANAGMQDYGRDLERMTILVAISLF